MGPLDAGRDAVPAGTPRVGADTPPGLGLAVLPPPYRRGMRLLHTSDWHLGRSFHREDLLSAQAGFVDFLVETVRSEQVDAVLVSGDVYDRALPSVDAVALFDDALRRLAATRTRVVLISGNHDSGRRLGFGSGLIDAAGIHLRTDVADAHRPIVLEDKDGPVAVYAIPYLEPDAVRAELGCDERSHAAVLGAAMARVRGDLSGRAGARSVVLAHAFVTGGETSESERDITVGGVASVPRSVFDGIDYAALGHLHGAQRLSDRVRYSGSPLPFSFSEEHQTKQLLLVELGDGPGAPLSVEQVPTPVHRPLARLSGRLDDLLTDPHWGGFAGHYLQVTLTDPVRPRDPMERLRSRFPHVLTLGFAPDGVAETSTSYSARVRGRTDVEMAADFVAHVRGPAEPAEAALLAAGFEAVRLAETSR
ncbi:MAG: repair protein SbcD/Mre11 [Actinomycetota bacterium]|nr:repair protein SbcD/Mre11 [Actinomycetota bacterium]